jgi:hypothetical protein
MTTGSPDWEISWAAAHNADTSSAPRSCISSMKIATPDAPVGREPADVAEQLDEVDLDVARVGPTGHRGHVDADSSTVAQATAPPRSPAHRPRQRRDRHRTQSTHAGRTP